MSSRPLQAQRAAQPEEGPEVVFSSAHRKGCQELALVLQSIGLPHRIIQAEGGFHLLVERAFAGRAREQIELYVRENSGWPPPAYAPVKLTRGLDGALVYALLMLAFFLIERRGAFGLDWLGAGKTHAGRIMDGEWWRCITALSLHTDISHLLGNMFFGGLFGALLCQLVGTAVGWSTILLAGSLGNLLNALIQPAEHTSVGASTAIFGALGALVAWQWMRRASLQQRPARRWSSLIAGLVLLAYLGMSGERTDIMAHITGFSAGLLTGTGGALLLRRTTLGALQQKLVVVLTLALFGAAWVIALSA